MEDNNERSLIKPNTQLELAKAGNMIAITNRLLSKTLDLQKWWDELDEEWKKILLVNLGVSQDKERSHFYSKLLDYELPQKTEFETIRNISTMERLDCYHTQITSLEPIRNLINMEVLYCGGTKITSLEPIRNLTNMKLLHLENTQIDTLAPIYNLPKLKKIICSNTKIPESEIKLFKKMHPNCDVDGTA